MKGHSQSSLEASRPTVSPRQAVSFCLGRLYADRVHLITDEVVAGLTYEELTGTLLLARDALDGDREELL